MIITKFKNERIKKDEINVANSDISLFGLITVNLFPIFKLHISQPLKIKNISHSIVRVIAGTV